MSRNHQQTGYQHLQQQDPDTEPSFGQLFTTILFFGTVLLYFLHPYLPKRLRFSFPALGGAAVGVYDATVDGDEKRDDVEDGSHHNAKARHAMAKNKHDEWPRPKKAAGKKKSSSTNGSGKGAGGVTGRIAEARENGDFKGMQAIAEKLRKEGKTWRDPTFSGNAALFESPDLPPDDWLRDGERGKPIKDATVSWQAPGKFCVSHKPLGVRADGEATWLYCHDGGKHKETEAASALDMDEGMICQGSLGDCYLLAALAAVVREDIISDDLIDEEFEDVGIYGVSLRVGGVWKMVWVDELFPCFRPKRSSHAGRWRLIFASCSDQKEIWPIVVEKAFAKLFGSYEALSGGFVVNVLCALTGGHGASVRLHPVWGQMTTQMVFDVVKHARNVADADAKNNQDESLSFVGAGKLDDSFPRSLPDLPPTVARGLITAHAYTILNCVELGPGEDDPRLIQLRNPWNRHEWHGPWSNGDALWRTDEGRSLKKKIQTFDHEADTGAFWMSIEDFIGCFRTLDICDLTMRGRQQRMDTLHDIVHTHVTRSKAKKGGKKSTPKTTDLDALLSFIEDGSVPPKKSGKKKSGKKKSGKKH